MPQDLNFAASQSLGYLTKFGNDENHQFDVNIAIKVDTDKLLNIMSYISNVPPKYDLDNYNCSDFAIEVGKLAGLPLTNSFGIWPSGGGSNPAQLGQNIRNMPLPLNSRRQTTGAVSGSNRGTCN